MTLCLFFLIIFIAVLMIGAIYYGGKQSDKLMPILVAMLLLVPAILGYFAGAGY